MSEKEMNYESAFKELQDIVSEIELGQITVDILSEKVKRAAELIAICKTKLSSTEEDVNKILKELEELSVVTLQHENRNLVRYRLSVLLHRETSFRTSA